MELETFRMSIKEQKMLGGTGISSQLVGHSKVVPKEMPVKPFARICKENTSSSI